MSSSSKEYVRKRGQTRETVAERFPDKRRRSDSDDERRKRKPERRNSPQFSKDRHRDRNRPIDETKFQWGKQEMKKEKTDEEEKPKEKPNFGTTGKLAADTNTFKGVVIKYNEPPEARKPKMRWRLYPFKGDESLPTWFIHRQSAYLIGRDRRIVDIPIDHPSSSKQHAAIQYRCIPETKLDGRVIRKIKPYIIDLASANGTYLNNNRIEPQKYYELLEKDVVKFGFSSREYVVMNEKTGEGEIDEDASPSDVEDEQKAADK